MLKVLVVHDRADVLADIRELLEKIGVPAHLISEAEDGQAARRQLVDQQFDLAIFDLTIPPVKGQSEPGYGTAEDIFIELFHSDSYNVPGDIIGITREAAALTRVNTSIGPHLMAIIEEDVDGGWRGLLTDRVQYSIKSANMRLQSISRRYDYDVAIITALDEELLPFFDLFTLVEVAHFPGAREFIFNDLSGQIRRGVIFSVGGAGQAACASATQALIARFRPKAFFLSGFCGGYQEKTQPGETLLFRSVYDWDSGKWETPKAATTQEENSPQEPRFLPRADPIQNGDGEAYRVMRLLAREGIRDGAELERTIRQQSEGEVTGLKFTIAKAASGSAVVANTAILGQIRKQHDQIIGVDMECYGFYSACSQTPCVKPEMLCVKSVADFCDGDKHDRLHATSSLSSAKTIEDLILYKWRFGT